MYLKTPCRIVLKTIGRQSQDCVAIMATETAITVRYPCGGVVYKDIIPWSNIEYVRTKHRKETISEEEAKPQLEFFCGCLAETDEDGFDFSDID